MRDYKLPKIHHNGATRKELAAIIHKIEREVFWEDMRANGSSLTADERYLRGRHHAYSAALQIIERELNK